MGGLARQRTVSALFGRHSKRYQHAQTCSLGDRGWRLCLARQNASQATNFRGSDQLSSSGRWSAQYLVVNNDKLAVYMIDIAGLKSPRSL
jgi:hypothetical protein